MIWTSWKKRKKNVSHEQHASTRKTKEEEEEQQQQQQQRQETRTSHVWRVLALLSRGCRWGGINSNATSSQNDEFSFYCDGQHCQLLWGADIWYCMEDTLTKCWHTWKRETKKEESNSNKEQKRREKERKDQIDERWVYGEWHIFHFHKIMEKKNIK